jgi:fatty acid desaturase
LGVFFSTTQHAGLAEDVLDHRLNSRTVYMNPVFRFLYWNMNYHLEHHLFPTVPFHALPRLHEAAKRHCPAPYTSCWAAYREILPALLRQRTDAGWCVLRPLPSSSAAEPRESRAVTLITSGA